MGHVFKIRLRKASNYYYLKQFNVINYSYKERPQPENNNKLIILLGIIFKNVILLQCIELFVHAFQDKNI
jgi:hypothetical protein